MIDLYVTYLSSTRGVKNSSWCNVGDSLGQSAGLAARFLLVSKRAKIGISVIN